LQEIILRKVFSTADTGKKLDTKIDRTKKKQKDIHACMEDTVSLPFLLYFNEHFSLSI
jgi:hypothetical protein